MAAKTTAEERAALPVVLIRPSRGWAWLDLRALWEYRELLYFLVWRDLKARYKQTLLGAAWAILQPLLATAVFSVIFGLLIQVPSEGLPYPAFAYAALLPWNCFATALRRSSMSVVENANLVTKVYFPRLILPLAGVIGSLVDLGFGLAVMFGLLLLYSLPLTPALLLLPVLVLLGAATALAAGLWLSALNARYRDVTYVLAFLTQVWMYATPVVYSSTVIPERWRPFYALNPMVGVVDGFRWALLGQGQIPGQSLGIAAAAGGALLLGGLFYFRQMERTFADVV